jgi:hypothetical protein
MNHAAPGDIARMGARLREMLQEDFVDTVMTTARVANEEESRATDAPVLCFAAQSQGQVALRGVQRYITEWKGWVGFQSLAIPP